MEKGVSSIEPCGTPKRMFEKPLKLQPPVFVFLFPISEIGKNEIQ